MTLFRERITCRDAQDIKVLAVGAICTVTIYVVVTAISDIWVLTISLH
jgi:hypothetical protein